jgi:hypothetical protein
VDLPRSRRDRKRRGDRSDVTDGGALGPGSASDNDDEAGNIPASALLDPDDDDAGAGTTAVPIEFDFSGVHGSSGEEL